MKWPIPDSFENFIILNCVEQKGKNIIASKSNFNSDEHLHFNDRLLAGSFAGFSTQTIIYPLEFIKTRLIISQKDQYSGAWDTVYRIYRSQGIVAFYRGYLPSVFGTVPTVAINLSVYEVSSEC